MVSNKIILDPDIFNVALKMATEFGPNLMQPIQERLLKEYPQLCPKHLAYYNEITTKARDEGHRFVYKQMEQLAAKSETISKSWSKALFDVHMQAKFPLIDNENLSHLYSQGCYYCRKDGIITPLEND